MSSVDLDDRMTDESKAFVTNALKSMRPADSIKMDVNVSRQYRIANAMRINASLTFEDVTVNEFTVNNIEDNHEIAIVAFLPKAPIKHSPITIV